MPYADRYSDLYDPAFPQSGLDIRTELLLGGAWTDVSKLLYQRSGVVITRGHADESSQLQPSTAAGELNNRSGNLSPRNPYGAYFGLLGRNTSLRLSTPAASSHLRVETDNTSFAGCPPTTALQITGSIDIRIDVRLSDSRGRFLASMWGGAWNFGTTDAGMLYLQYTPDGIHTTTATSTVQIPATGRRVLRVTLDVTTGNVTFYTAPAGGVDTGPYTQLGAVVAGSGATSLNASTARLETGQFYGSVYKLELRNGIGGTVVASPDFTTLVPGTTMFADAQGNVWTLAGTAEISNRRYRIHGEVPAWPPRWDNTGQDVYVPVEASGILRRLTQGTPPVQSTLYRGYLTLTGALAPVAYWACEDGSGATQIASALPGGIPMTVAGSPSFASNGSFVCSRPIPTLNGSSWRSPVSTPLTWSANVIRFLLQVPTGGDTNNAVVARVYTGGTVARMDVVYTAGASGSLTLNCYDFVGNLIGTIAVGNVLLPNNTLGGCNSWPMRVDVDLQASGSSVVAEIVPYVVGAPGAVLNTTTIASASIGPVTSVLINPGGGLTQTAIGHISVQRTADGGIFQLFQPLLAYAGETAGARFVRLCGEQGVASRIVGAPTDTVAMGPQPPADFISLLQQCEDADRGLMFEPRQVLGLGYRTRSSMCNQAAAVALDYSQAQLSPPLEPTDDDQYTVNDATVTRSSGTITGSSARQYAASGSESVQSPPNGVGDYGNAYSLNLATDGQAAQEAGWIVHVGTVDEPRYPAVTVDVTRAATASVSAAAQDADIGDRLTVANTPVTLPPDGVSQIIRGSVEYLNAFQLTEQYVCVPESPYRVGIYDDATYGHYDTDGAQIVGNLTAAATTFQVRTTNAGSPLWTTSAGDFPFDIEVSPAGNSGERMTVTNITGSSSPQTFTVTRAVNGVARSWPPGTDVRLFQPAVYSL